MKRLTRLLSQSQAGLGQVLRVLIGRIRQPDAPYTREDVEILLLLSLAEQRAAEAAPPVTLAEIFRQEEEVTRRRRETLQTVVPPSLHPSDKP